MAILASVGTDRRKPRVVCLGELDFPAGGDPYAVRLDRTVPVAGEAGMPAAAGFGEDSLPAKLLFQQPSIASVYAVCRAELNEESHLVRANAKCGEQVLEDLALGCWQQLQCRFDGFIVQALRKRKE